MRAIGYTRLSQASDTSIANQKDNIEEYIREKDWELVDILDDGEGSSGFTDDRPEYQSLLDMLPHVDVVVCNDNQRLARDPDEAMEVVLELRRADVEYHTWDDGKIDLSDPLDAIIAMLQGVIAGQAKLNEIKKAKEAIEKRQKQGYYQGGIPYGLRMDKETKRLEKDPVEWQRCEQIWKSGEYQGTTEWRILNRGREYYEDLLEQYG